jgi:hypothetical protein
MADVENPLPPASLEAPSAPIVPVGITEPVTTAKTDADGDVSINEGEETPEAQALAQGWLTSYPYLCMHTNKSRDE